MSSSTSIFPFVDSSLVDNEPEIGQEYELDECEDVKPALVELDSGSDSESCRDTALRSTLVKAVNATASTNEAESMGCLSDGFTSFLCPFVHTQPEDPQNLNVNAGGLPAGGLPRVPSVRLDASANAPAIDPFHLASSCAEFQLQDIIHAASTPGAEMLASLQSWLTAPLPKSSSAQHTHKRCRNRSETPASRAAHIHQLWSRWHSDNTIPLNRSKSCPKAPSKVHDPDDLCYDSDPDTVQRKKPLTVSSLEKQLRQSSAKTTLRRPPSLDTSLPDTPRNECPPTPRNAFYKSHPETPRNSAKKSFESPRSASELDQDLPSADLESKLFFHEIINSKVKLTWHRCATVDKNSKEFAPMGATAWFELGSHLDQAVVQPKFIWNPTYEPNLSQRRMSISCREPDAIELLSIVRVIAPLTLDRTKYPFARLDRTCCISTNDDQMYVFEASSTEERDRLVTAMKMLVARLASIIIVRDERMLLEFFSPFAGLQSLLDEPYELEDADEGDYNDDEYDTYAAPFLLSTTDEGRAILWGTV